MAGLDWSSLRSFSSSGEASAPDDYHWLSSLAGYKPVIEYCGGELAVHLEHYVQSADVEDVVGCPFRVGLKHRELAAGQSFFALLIIKPRATVTMFRV